MHRLLCVLGLTAACTAAAAAAGPVSGLLVELHEDAPAPRVQPLGAVLAERGTGVGAGQNAGTLRVGAALTGRWHRVTATATISAAAAEAWALELRRDPRVKSVVPDVREQRLAVTPSDARYADQWWLREVVAGNTGAAGFAGAWSRSTGAPASGAGAVVAVLDSGITSHPELNARIVTGHDFVSDVLYAGDGNGRDNDATDPGDAITAADRSANAAAFSGCPDSPVASWHGTVIAGQLAAVTNNGEGVAAGNWFGRVLPVRVAGKCGASVGDIVDGLRWAAGLTVAGVERNPTPARVIVLSYGGADPCDADSTTPGVAATARLYRDTIAEVRAAGALVVVAAGNQRGAVGRPASCSGAFGVAALNREGFKATYSNFGASLSLATPGGDAASGGTCDAQLADGGIVSTGNLGDTGPGAPGYVAASGTSFAAPAVAAAASLMLAVNPALSVVQLEDGLRRSARPHVQVPLLGECSASQPGRCGCTTATCGAGLLDADQALVFAAAPAAYAAPARSPVVLEDDRIRTCAVLLGRPLPEPAPAPAPAPTPTPAPAAATGGGAASLPWLLGLCAASVMLLRGRRADGGCRQRAPGRLARRLLRSKL